MSLNYFFSSLHPILTTSAPATNPWCLDSYNILPIGPQVLSLPFNATSTLQPEMLSTVKSDQLILLIKTPPCFLQDKSQTL